MTTTIILTVSRREFLSEVISSIEMLDCDQSYTNILCIVDGDYKLYTEVRNLILNTKFNERLTVQYPDRKKVKKFDIIFRRKRIASIHNFAKDFISDLSEYVLIVEDDTVIPRDALEKLKRNVIEIPGCVMSEGVEVGRWGTPYIGAWVFDDIYSPTKVTSLEYKKSGIDEIDAGGFYCSLFNAEIYKSHDFKLFELLGPDISMGLALRRQGFTCVINWSVPCKHLNIRSGNKEVFVPNDLVERVTLGRKNERTWVEIR